jgi:hypothetical protein
MQPFNFTKYACASALLLLMGSVAHAATLYVHCESGGGLNSIGAALKALGNSEESHGPSTINVSGACHENVTIQSMDHLTLTAINGASISDISSGALDVVDVNDSSEVTIAGFTINGGNIGIGCGGSLCRLTNDTVQGAGLGIGVFTLTRARLTGVTLLNNGTGLLVNHGGAVVGDATMRGNGTGLSLLAGGVAVISAHITQSRDFGIFESVNATLDCFSCVIVGNTAGGVALQEGSSALFRADITITGNGGPGVALSGLASALFRGGTITGNGGGTDVLCGTPFTSARGATFNIGGGKTNCIEPTP